MQQQSSQTLIHVEVENFRAAIPVPPEYAQRFQSINKEEAAEAFKPLAMFVIAGIGHQLTVEKEPPTGYQIFKSIYCAKDAGVGIPLSALQSRGGMSKFISDCQKQKTTASRKEFGDASQKDEEVLSYTLNSVQSTDHDFVRHIRNVLARFNFKKIKEHL